MGSGSSLFATVVDRASTLWSALRPTVTIELPNMAPIGDAASDECRARLSFLSDGEPYHEAAGAEYPERHFDTIQLEVLARLGTGSLAREVADDWATLWRGHPLDGFRFGVTQIVEVGSVGSGESSRWKVDALTRVERSFST